MSAHHRVKSPLTISEMRTLSTFDVLEAPKLGLLTVRKGVLTTDKVAGCPGLKIPAEVVFYRARAGAPPGLTMSSTR
jgi:hypothetical protein